MALALVAACKRDAAKEETKAEAKTEEGVDVTLSPSALAAAKLSFETPRAVPRRTAIVAYGTVDFVPSRVARVGPPIAGRVATVPVVPGQKVGRGAVLATIDSADVGRARADFLAAKTRVDQTKAEVEREQRLVTGGASTERALFVAQAENATAQAQLRAAEDRLATMGLGAGAGGHAIALTAPLAGTVLKVDARVGQPVGPTDTLLVVGETDQVWLAVDVYERDIGRVHVGDDVRVESVAYPGKVFEGKVDQLGSVVDPERRVLEARIVLANPGGELKPGMTATARILGAVQGGAGVALAVPRDAVQTIDGQPFVFVEHGPGKFELRPVERGSEIEGAVEIVRGLAAEERVVVSGSFILKSEALKSQMGSND